MKRVLALVVFVLLIGTEAFGQCRAQDLIALGINNVQAKALGCDGLVGNTSITGTLTSSGALTTTAGGHTVTAGGVTVTAGDLTLTNGGLKVPAGKNLELVAENGANTACDTTCTLGCIAGYDAGTSAFVACDSALADSCLCTSAP